MMGKPKRAQVSLRVYDPLGRVVGELVNGEVSEGSHEVVFHQTSLPAGVYFYELNAQSLGLKERHSMVLTQ